MNSIEPVSSTTSILFHDESKCDKVTYYLIYTKVLIVNNYIILKKLQQAEILNRDENEKIIEQPAVNQTFEILNMEVMRPNYEQLIFERLDAIDSKQELILQLIENSSHSHHPSILPASSNFVSSPVDTIEKFKSFEEKLRTNDKHPGEDLPFIALRANMVIIFEILLDYCVRSVDFSLKLN